MTDLSSPLPEDKPGLRRRMKRERAALAERAGVAAGEALARAAWSALDRLGVSMDGRGQPAVVAGYWPANGEIDPRFLLRDLDVRGIATALPVVDGADAPLGFRLWAPGEPMVEGAFSIPVPEEAAPRVVPDVVLVPLLAFDARGHRLGYGGGYYDRTLAALRAQGASVAAVGLAYAAQQVAAVPSEPWDVPLDAIITDQGDVPVGAARSTDTKE